MAAPGVVELGAAGVEVVDGVVEVLLEVLDAGGIPNGAIPTPILKF